jgi:Recombination endonuclease VII
MSAPDQGRAAQDLCGKWMPRKQTGCARGAGHPPPCSTPEAMERQRQRAAARALIHGRRVNPVVKARWRKAYKLQRYGLTQERFEALLEEQGNACGMCGEAFTEDELIYIDHDHACCPVAPRAQTRCCGKCVRGLLCFRCNTALGYVEMYEELARAYLSRSGKIRAA